MRLSSSVKHGDYIYPSYKGLYDIMIVTAVLSCSHPHAQPEIHCHPGALKRSYYLLFQLLAVPFSSN
ncbi:hypothetical protein LENED_005720 [Lentinula edodes]|uniref:Uncharacterized protein n=1 Tax=Lentinula edodes TaxID=5353 RepID=A0A1Q3E9R9_LENED|nr:hypothetical protein LENED_005720 [Lentinula edodes]